MEKESDKHTVFPKGSIVGFDFEKMIVIRSTGKVLGPWPVCEVETITATQMQRLTDCFQDDLAAGRT